MHNINGFIHTVLKQFLKWLKWISLNSWLHLVSHFILMFSHNSIYLFNIVIMGANVYLFASVCHVLCVLRPLHTWLHFIFTAISRYGDHYYHFIDEKAEAQGIVTKAYTQVCLCSESSHTGYLLQKMSCNTVKRSETLTKKISHASRRLGNLGLPAIDMNKYLTALVDHKFNRR